MLQWSNFVLQQTAVDCSDALVEPFFV